MSPWRQPQNMEHSVKWLNWHKLCKGEFSKPNTFLWICEHFKVPHWFHGFRVNPQNQPHNVQISNTQISHAEAYFFCCFNIQNYLFHLNELWLFHAVKILPRNQNVYIWFLGLSSGKYPGTPWASPPGFERFPWFHQSVFFPCFQMFISIRSALINSWQLIGSIRHFFLSFYWITTTYWHQTYLVMLLQYGCSRFAQILWDHSWHYLTDWL